MHVADGETFDLIASGMHCGHALIVGTFVEWQYRSSAGHDRLCELTFYNDGRAERTDYFDGRILQMIAIPERPQSRGA